jgi:hypothetical protein
LDDRSWHSYRPSRPDVGVGGGALLWVNAAGRDADGAFFPTGLALLGFATTIASIATVLLVVAVRGQEAALPVKHRGTLRAAVAPVHFRRNLDASLSRSRWLVKWFLAIPHLIVSFFGGGYPRSTFDFAMGMQRWSYRVLSCMALMTDAYPPLRLDAGEFDPPEIPQSSPTVKPTHRPLAGVAPA